jgi:uncharacterized protein YbjT (DUF2867 family)
MILKGAKSVPKLGFFMNQAIIGQMILVTGGTGFVGRVLTRHLVTLGKPVRLLLRPSKKTPTLPVGVPVEVAVCSLTDERGMRAALQNVDQVIHLVGTEWLGSRAKLEEVDLDSSRLIAKVAKQADVRRVIYLSHLGADRASGFPLLKAKGLAEGYFIQSGVPYTIFRSAVLFGPDDHFTTALARLIKASPGIFLMPGDGNSVLQPLWVEDLVTCIGLALEDETTSNQVISVGGGEYLTFYEIIVEIMRHSGVRRRTTRVVSGYMRWLAIFMENMFPRFPVSLLWLDYLAMNRTCALDTLPRLFGLIPARFSQQLDYLKKPVKREKKR